MSASEAPEVAFSRALRAEPLMIGVLSPGKPYLVSRSVLGEQVADLFFDEFEEFGIVDLVGLVHEHDDIRNADLTGEQDVLTGLGHGTVGRSDDEDSAVHLCSTGDHVLDVVGMSRAVNVRIVALVRLILDVRGVDRDTTSLFFRRLVDLG